MMKSMTAYARVEKSTENTTVSVEIRAHNSRFLDHVLRLPQAYNPLEDKIKTLISEFVDRGRIDMKLQITDASETTPAFEINTPRAKAYYRALRELKAVLNLDDPVSLEQIATAGDVIKPLETHVDLERNWVLLEACLRQALEELDDMRRREGDFIATDMRHRLAMIARSLHHIAAESKDLPLYYRDRLKERIAALTNGLVETDPQRILQEAAILADKSDITEEIVRAESHLKQFQAIMQADEPAGRKLNFLLQELHREFNTIGAKTEKSVVSHLVVEVKSELEKIREQLQNVE
jgi:uncharacterized protein (TIGR00255 family)